MNSKFSEYSPALRMRWFVENCCEIKLPDGKTIVIDPMLLKAAPESDGNGFQALFGKDFVSGFSVDDLEGCDYVIITHVHGDHIGSLREVYEKFKPTILVNGWSAYALAKFYDMPLGAFLPMTDGCEYNLGSFRLTALPGRHSPPICLQKPSAFSYGEGLEKELGWMGSLYSSNFVITLPNNFKIAMDGGWYEPNLSEWEKHRPNLILRHRMQDLEECSDQMVDAMQRGGAQFLMPLCQQNTKVGISNIVRAANEKLAKAGHWGRVIDPGCGQWLNFFAAYTAE